MTQSIHDRKCVVEDSPCLTITLLVLNALAFIAVLVFVNWNYCRLAYKTPCSGDVRSNLTSTQKEKCDKYAAGTTKYKLVNRTAFTQ